MRNPAIRIGLVGTGVMGAEHARLLSREIAGAELAAVADPRREQAAAIAGGARVFADAMELVESDGVDAVVIASPDATHAPLACAAIARGKPVLVEKPIGSSAAEGRSVVDAEMAAGRRLVTVGYMRRFDPAYNAMKSALAAGDVGKAQLLHNVHRNVSVPDWFRGPMVLTNSFVHEIDISRFLLDDEMVSGLVLEMPDGGPTLVTMKTAGGLLVSTEVNINAHYGYHVQAEIVGTLGTVELAPPATLIANRNLRSGHAYPENWVPRFADAYRIQMQAWVSAIAYGGSVGASAWDGYAATAIAEKLAAGEYGSWVDIGLPPRPSFYDQVGKP